MKRPRSSIRNPRAKKVACTVSAAALMLGVSQAASIGLHFQENYCGSAAYSGFPVTLSAFGIPPSGWENLTAMDTGYGSCAGPLGYTFNQVISTNTSTGGLNPLPRGALNVTWFGPTANFSGFAGYAGSPPHYNYTGAYPYSKTQPTGEEQIYATFLRDGINFGPEPGGGRGPDNNQPGYSVDITGLKSLFPSNSFVIELIAASDSMQTLTNAFIIDVVGSTTNSVTYPNTPPVADAGLAPWARGQGGGLSTVSAPLNTDHVQIISNHPQHGGTGFPPTGFDNAGTISGFIITDKPVVTMSPQPVLAGPGDNVTLSPYAIGVPPLAYQWRLNGLPIAGATNLNYGISNAVASKGGNYDLVVTNIYGSATSHVAAVTVDSVGLAFGTNLVDDTNPSNTPHLGRNIGATWLASSSDGTISRSGVEQFVAATPSKITVPGTTDLDVATGTVMFWMRSAGVDTGSGGNAGAALFGRTTGNLGDDFILVQQDGGNLLFDAPLNAGGIANSINSAAIVSDNKWHFVAVTFDQSDSGGAALYVDGVLDTTNANSSSWSWPSGKQIELGFTSDSFWRSYNGLLDDVRVYSRQLTAAEILSVRNTGALVDTAALRLRENYDTPKASGITLTWSEPNVILQSATSVTGPYTDITTAASPYDVPLSGTKKFYRYRNYIPKTFVTNPYLM